MKQRLYKICAVILTMAVILSTCICAIGTVSAREATYYVSASGDDTTGTGTDSAPLKTIDAAITAAKKASYTAGDTVTVKVIGETAVAWKSVGTQLTAHDFKVKITSSDTQNISTVGTGAIANIHGDIEFENIALNVTGAYLATHGNDVTFGLGVTVTPATGYYLMGANAGPTTYTDDFTVELKSGFGYLFAGNYQGAATFDGNITLIYDNANGSPKIRTAGQDGSVSTYNKLLNINIKAANGVSFDRGQYAAFGENGYIQVINSSVNSITASSLGLSSQYNDKIYIIDDNTGVENAISFTDTQGKFKVNIDTSEYTLKVDGELAEINDGYISLTAGEHKLSVQNAPQKVTYYVGASGDDSTGTGIESAPFKTIDAVINAANAKGLSSGDAVTVKVIGETAVAWKSVGTQLTAHEFKLIITSNDLQNLSTLGTGAIVNIHGPLEIENINVNTAEYIAVHGNNVVIGEGVTKSSTNAMFYLGGNVGNTFSNDFNITVKSGYSHIFAGGYQGVTTFDGNVTFTYDNPEGTVNFRTTPGSGSGVMQYNKLLNVNIKSGNVIFNSNNNGQYCAFGENGYMQVINSTESNITTSALKLDSAYTNKSLIINDKTGLKDVFDFTNTLGKFKVNLNTDIYTLMDGNEPLEINDGYITLSTGVHNLSVEKEPAAVTYYMSSTGNDTTGNGDKTAPFLTLDGAIKAANAAGYSKNDTVTVKALGEEAIGWLAGDTYITEHTFKLIVTSDNLEALATVGTGVNAVLGGDTYFENIKINFGNSYKFIAGANHNVSFGNGTEFVGDVFKAFYYLGKYSGSTAYDKDINVETKISIRSFGISNAVSSPIYNGNINVVYDAANGTPKFLLSTDQGTTTYNGLVNINIKSATSATFDRSSGVAFGTNGYLQILNSMAALITATESGLENLPQDKLFIINNKLGTADALALTDTVGKYKVNIDTERFNILVNENITAVDAQGFITIAEAGEYTVGYECKGNHTYDDCTDTECNVCGGTDLTRNHKYDYDCSKECSVCGELNSNAANHTYDDCDDSDCNVCGEINLETGGHIYDGCTDTECNICGKTDVSRSHKYDYACSEKCSKCGEVNPNIADHTYDGCADTECNLCGDIDLTRAHIYDHACSEECSACGQANPDATDHTYDDCTDTECNVCGGVDSNRTHKYDHACSEECSACGQANPDAIDHTYDGCVDTECNVCGDIDSSRTHKYEHTCSEKCSICNEDNPNAQEHTYDEKCSQQCSVCGEIDLTRGHIYISPCDKDCNVCGDIRQVGEHIYESVTDEDCDICGECRELGVQLIKENGVYQYYQDGDKSTATKLVKYNGKYFYIKKGIWQNKAKGLVKVSGKWWYVESGKWSNKTTDLIKYNGSWFYVKGGKWNSSTNDLIKIDGTYWLINNGKWTAKTTLFKKSGKFFSIKGGKWSKTTQIITYSGKKFYCKSGFAQLGFTGKAKVGSKTYNIVKGQVK